ncbi:MAG: 3-hydroxyacyl-CoA dehydrogenase NAD-binding domain-containing protein [Planctomycetota bacterium]|jgi:3-hydroxybutyryl-CoA dehydrogenase
MPVAGVIGAGTMGAGIAQVAAVNGWNVWLRDVDGDLVERTIKGIRARLDRLVEKGRLSESDRDTAAARLRRAGSAVSLSDADLIVEAVVEDIGIKVEVFNELRAHLRDTCILASNTSSLSITAMAEALGRSDHVIGMHFFNPVPLLPLVEIINTPLTAPGVAERAVEIAGSWGKTVVRCKDTPGFIVNRVARGYYLEAMRIMGEGVASIVEIDDVMQRLGGFRMGPFTLMDLVGIDVNYTVSCSVYEQKNRPARLKPHPVQERLFNEKLLGRKSKRGFYDYAGDEPAVAVECPVRSFEAAQPLLDAVRAFAGGATDVGGDERAQYVFSRILVTIINEAALAMDEGVASAEDIDTAMKTGTNYPHGPLAWGRQIGFDHCVALLGHLNATVDDDRFAAARYLG